MDRVFLDANVLFSAAYRSDTGLQRLWALPHVELITSAYALEEARRNVQDRDQRARLQRLAESMTVVAGFTHPLPGGAKLPAKDQPILATAIHARATHLLTGDLTHFGPYYGRTFDGVLILRPAEYLRDR